MVDVTLNVILDQSIDQQIDDDRVKSCVIHQHRLCPLQPTVSGHEAHELARVSHEVKVNAETWPKRLVSIDY